MGREHRRTAGRRRRLTEELAEEGFDVGSGPAAEMLLDEVDYALHPQVHERRVPSYGAFVDPTADPARWETETNLQMTHRTLADSALEDARRFADGLSSFLVRTSGRHAELVVFDRTAGSERDLVVLAEATGGLLVQRHPSGLVRVVGPVGVMRWDGIDWHLEPPVSKWIDDVSACCQAGHRSAVAKLLTFAVHDLGSRGIGALLIHLPDGEIQGNVEERMAEPPHLQIGRPADLAPLRHALAQIDGASFFDATGTLRHLGVRLVPSAEAEADVDGLRGMRHTSARRYSFDDPDATVIVVSEDGPVTVMRNGEILGRSGTR